MPTSATTSHIGSITVYRIRARTFATRFETPDVSTQQYISGRLLRRSSNCPRRVSGDDDIIRHIVSYDASCADDAPFPERHAFEDDCADADPRTPSNFNRFVQDAGVVVQRAGVSVRQRIGNSATRRCRMQIAIHNENVVRYPTTFAD